MNLVGWLEQGDALSHTVGLLLFVMSVAGWVVILWKSWLLRRAAFDVTRTIAAFWQSATLLEALPSVRAFDRESLVMPLIEASQQEGANTLAGVGDLSQQLTRVLRDALQRVVQRLQWGQVWLASVGATAPFVGLLGTVWGIYHALTGIAQEGQITVERISGPVGEALLMTAGGLVVAIPAVLAYNILGRMTARIEADLEGFALDLRELVLSGDAKGKVQ